jgi:signal transduction histidine kinase
MLENLRRAKEDVDGLNARLMAEIESKLKAEAELRASHEQLERLVNERTADLLAANEQLTAARDAAEAANMAKSEFLANMSHEMRTPLAGTLGMIRLVLEMEIGDEERQFLEMADRSAESLLRIIADVLDFSRLEAGMMTFEQELFSIPEVIRSAVEVVSLTAREKGLDLSWKVEGSVPQQVQGDEGRLRQVLVNILGNAVKFTEQGRIEVFVRRLDDAEPPGSGFVQFSVRDTGMGIPTDQIEMIFGKFTQVDSSITRRYGGTGLGLALTRQIVEKLGGRIWVESSIGAGSTFHFTFHLK